MCGTLRHSVYILKGTAQRMTFAYRVSVAALSLLPATVLLAQNTQHTVNTTTAVPRLVRINSSFHPATAVTAGQIESVVFSIYSEESGGSPLWQETQNITLDSDGHYSVLLGFTRNEGLPAELFASGESRWLGLQVQRAGEVEQPRVLLASVPYALKAGDAETLGGRPASAYVVAESVAGGSGGAPATTGNTILK